MKKLVFGFAFVLSLAAPWAALASDPAVHVSCECYTHEAPGLDYDMGPVNGTGHDEASAEDNAEDNCKALTTEGDFTPITSVEECSPTPATAGQ